MYMEYTHVHTNLSEKAVVMQMGYKKYCGLFMLATYEISLMYLCTYVH